ncbi:MAG: hypothetical protein RLZZ46_194 [Bacteroidota bacterium]
MKFAFTFLLILLMLTCGAFPLGNPVSVFPVSEAPGAYGLRKCLLPGSSATLHFVECPELYQEGLDTLTKTIFWRTLVNTGKDTLIFYGFPSRNILSVRLADNWDSLNPEMKNCALDSMRSRLTVDDEKVSYMRGRNYFYNVKAVVPQINRAVQIFGEQNTDPFYAQAILLIESPGRLQKSTVGAYGPFQLMKSVGKQFGLKVNSRIDERADLEKSAIAATRLINRVCIPYANKMLGTYNIAVCPTDLWYRLLVLHIYHAGAGNVSRALSLIQPETGNMELIKKLWHTRAGGFQNASQNYSQIAIATLLELDNHLKDLESGQASLSYEN